MRIKNLDFLRAIAIIAVLFQHGIVKNSFTQVGWAGVDLFFVLSGFLVSSLLFNEINKNKSADTRLFLIRRGFKIYPAFYFFLLGTLLYQLFIYHKTPGWSRILAELFFLQSYLPSVWLHSWSLAIEEHFYLLIAILVWVMIKTCFIFKKRHALLLLISIWLLLVYMRFRYCIDHRTEDPIIFLQSHLRGDGLLLGCILAYCSSFVDNTKSVFVRYRLPFLFAGIVFLAPLYFWKAGSFYMDSFGITSLHLAFAMIIGVASFNRTLAVSKRLNQVFNLFCYIGLHSYSIYLWHAFVMEECDRYLTNKVYHSLVYFPSSILIGILFSKLIERPALKMRERFFPRKFFIEDH